MDLRDNNPQKKWKNREFTASFEFALTGIITAFKEERNMRKHLVSAILVVLAGLIFRVSATEWLFLLIAIFCPITWFKNVDFPTLGRPIIATNPDLNVI